jgi:hypothetical protein
MSISFLTRSRSSITLLIATVLAVMPGAEIGCSSPPPQISLEDQYAVLSPLFIGAGSVFLTIRNAGGRDELMGASISLPNTVVELHDVRDNRMVRVEKVAVPSRGRAELTPGGRHIMIFNMPKTIQEGSEITVTLRFKRSGEKSMQVRFQKEI